jgi:trehalose-phosphatase
MRVPFHQDGVISQFEGYEQLEELDWEGYRKRYGSIQRLDRILEAEGDTPNRYKVSKQADVLMLLYLLSEDELRELLGRLGYELTPDAISRTIAYYLARTSHGSTLSGVVDAWVLARSERERAWKFLLEALESDVSDVQGGTTAEGVHLGAMAGTVDLVQRAFSGMQARGDVLWFDPALPVELPELRFSVHYRGHRVDVTISAERFRVAARPGPGRPIKLGLRDKVIDLEPGGTVELTDMKMEPPLEGGRATIRPRAAVRPQAGVRRLAAPLERTALCLDFDGTLAPIVPDPEAARPLDGTVELLGRLAARAAAVALISGRPAAFLAAHAGAPGVRLLGLYGLEEARDGQVQVAPELAAAQPAVRAALADLQAAPAVRESGAYLEDKGSAVGVHLRRVAEPERWAEPVGATVGEVGARHGLEVLPGRLVWELRPAVRRDKGDAVRQVVAASGASAVVVAGDDRGDLAAFDAVAELAGRPGMEGLRIAVRSAEAPPELLAHADLVLDGPQGLRAYLEGLLG